MVSNIMLKKSNLFIIYLGLVLILILSVDFDLVYGKQYISIGAGVSLREQPNVNSKRIGLIQFGDIFYSYGSVEKDDNDNVWYKVAPPYLTSGWIYSKFALPFIPEKKNSIYLKISQEKFKRSKNNFGDLVELKEFIDEILFGIDDERIIDELEELRNDVLQRSIEIIPKNKKDKTPYKEWLLKHDCMVSDGNLYLEETDYTTHGDNSPIISNIEGGVNIIYGEKNNKKIRITYYRLKGVSADFLVKGMLSPEWEKILGGQQDIINNKVLKNARKILSMFSMAPYGHKMYVHSNRGRRIDLTNDIHAYAKNLKYNENVFFDETGKWDFYLQGREDYFVEYPDKEGMKVILDTERWPKDYHLFYSCYINNFGEQENVRPIIWKYLTRRDLENYYKNIEEYVDYIYDNYNVTSVRSGSLKAEREYIRYNSSLIKPLKNLTRNSFPEDFIVVYGFEGPHGGWELVFNPREIEVEIAVVENIYNRAIGIKNLRYSELNEYRLLPHDMVSKKLQHEKEKLTPISVTGILAAGEKIVIPLRLSFVNSFDLPKCQRPPNRDESIFLMNGVESDNSTPMKIYKRREAMSDNTYPSITKRYNYGPSWMLLALEVDSAPSKIRKANFNQFTLHLSNEKGSCPFIYSKDIITGLWRSQGHMLLGATSVEAMRKDKIRLENFTGLLKISENEDEIAFIKEIYVEEVNKASKSITHHHPADIASPIEVIRGKPKILHFITNPSSNSEFYLNMKGYYIPFSHIKFHKEFYD